MARYGRDRRSGQALVIVALVLPVLIALVMTSIDIIARLSAWAQVEDALNQATRTAVQTFDYAAFAQGTQALRADALTIVGCADLTPEHTRTVACAAFETNLSGVRGLAESPHATAMRVVWTLLPHGGTCAVAHAPPVTLATAGLCATVYPHLTGLFGWGVVAPSVDAVATLDASS